MSENACTTALYESTIYQSGVVELSSYDGGQSTIVVNPGATWNFTSDNGITYENLSEIADQTFGGDGTIAKIGGTGTTVIAVDFGMGFGSVIVATGTLAFDGPNNIFTTYTPIGTTISGAGTLNLGGGGADSINAATTITTGSWTITGTGTAVTLNEALTYSGIFTEQSGSSLSLNDNLTLGNATFDGAVTGSSSAEIALASGAMLHIEDLASNVSGSQIQNFNVPIGGFTSGEKIILQGFGKFPTINGTSPNYNINTNTTMLGLTYTTGGTTSTVATLEFTGGNYSSATLSADPNISGAIDVAFCFMQGTMIRAPRGDVAVEMLKRGDLISSIDGRPIPVSWLGRQTIATRFADPLRVLPIRIKAGALGDNVPSRDLLLSPDHALLVDDVLIQAGALVNGISILRENNVAETFTYYHVEVDDHSLILAENAPAETFIDNVDRLSFDNWHEYEALYPEGRAILEMPYPRAKAYRQVPRVVRQRLEHRSTALYPTISTAAA